MYLLQRIQYGQFDTPRLVERQLRRALQTRRQRFTLQIFQDQVGRSVLVSQDVEYANEIALFRNLSQVFCRSAEFLAAFPEAPRLFSRKTSQAILPGASRAVHSGKELTDQHFLLLQQIKPSIKHARRIRRPHKADEIAPLQHRSRRQRARRILRPALDLSAPRANLKLRSVFREAIQASFHLLPSAIFCYHMFFKKNMNPDILFRIRDKFLLHSDHQMLLFHTLFHTMSIAPVLSLDFPLHLVSQAPVMIFLAPHFVWVPMSPVLLNQSSFLSFLMLL